MTLQKVGSSQTEIQVNGETAYGPTEQSDDSTYNVDVEGRDIQFSDSYSIETHDDRQQGYTDDFITFPDTNDIIDIDVSYNVSTQGGGTQVVINGSSYGGSGTVTVSAPLNISIDWDVERWSTDTVSCDVTAHPDLTINSVNKI